MPTSILGISAYYHDSAACLVVDGRVVAAAQEERFTRKKHDEGFPHHAVRYCLAEGAVGPGGLDGVVFYDKPLLKFHRILETYLAVAPRGLRSAVQAIPLWLKEKLWIPPQIEEAIEEYVDQSYTKSLAVLPLRKDGTDAERAPNFLADHDTAERRR